MRNKEVATIENRLIAAEIEAKRKCADLSVMPNYAAYTNLNYWRGKLQAIRETLLIIEDIKEE